MVSLSIGGSAALLIALLGPSILCSMFGGTRPLLKDMNGIQTLISIFSQGRWGIEIMTIFEVNALRDNTKSLSIIDDMLEE